MKKIFLAAFAMGILQMSFAQSKENVKFKAPVIKKDKANKTYKDDVAIAPTAPAAPAAAPPPPPPRKKRSAKPSKVTFTAPKIVKEEVKK
jgi:hypothetical protein